MGVFCHRCGAELPGGEVRGFCPACGAPQLTVGDLEWVRAETAPAGDEAADAAPPPPRPGAIRWAEALQCGGLVAATAGVLLGLGAVLPVFSSLGIFFVLAGATLSLALYRRRLPDAPMSRGIGAQIGAATAVLVVAAMGVVLAGSGVWARFRTADMAPFDAQWQAQMDLLLARTHQMAAAQGQGGAEAAAEVAQMVARPEFRAWVTLFGFAAISLVLLVVLTGSGAMAGAIRDRRRPR